MFWYKPDCSKNQMNKNEVRIFLLKFFLNLDKVNGLELLHWTTGFGHVSWLHHKYKMYQASLELTPCTDNWVWLELWTDSILGHVYIIGAFGLYACTSYYMEWELYTELIHIATLNKSNMFKLHLRALDLTHLHITLLKLWIKLM